MDRRGLWTKIALSWILDYYSIIVNFLHRGFWTIMVYHGLSWIMDYDGLVAMDSDLSWITMDYRGLPWVIMDYRGFLWVDYALWIILEYIDCHGV